MKIPYIPLLLLFLGIFSCTYHEKNVYINDKADTKNTLSDISKKIVAIPLETTPACQIKEVKQVQQTGSDLFLLNENEIYHFNCSGSYLNKISLDNDAVICNYTINPENRQLAVLDSMQQLHYFSYSGHKQKLKDLSSSLLCKTLYKVVYHDNHFWAIGENISLSNCFEKWLYKFDVDFNLQESIMLSNVEIGRFYLNSCFTPELSVANNMLYVYSPFSFKETILQDTLYLASSNQLSQNLINNTIDKKQSVYTLPFRMNQRYLIASYQANNQEEENYLFCYDRKEQRAFPFQGFNDDFYQTGLVTDLQSADVCNNQFYFYKFGQDVLKSFPERTVNDNPVLFLITLKS